MDNILLNKMASLKKCLQRIDSEYQNDSQSFMRNITKQEAIILNLQRVCEISIDIANHIIRIKKLGLPQTSRDSFKLLESNQLIDQSLSLSLQSMIGFRNIAVHEYEILDLDIVENIIKNKLSDIKFFAGQMLTLQLKS